MIGVLLFFYSQSKVLIILASTFAGIARGGGEIVWNLWITKIVPRENFSTYMSVNIAVTGIRGLLSPFIGYALLNYFSLRQISHISAVLVLISSFGIFLLMKHPRLTKSI
jgi:MFS family permease